MSRMQGSGVDPSLKVFLLLCSLLLLNAVSVSPMSPGGLVLLELKKAITDDPHDFLTDWNEADALPCGWTGITCSVAGEVVGINLNLANFTGSVPESIGQIKSLVNISLATSFLHGPIPSSIFNLTSLKFLDLHSNEFSGVIPSGFSRMLDLEYLDLSSNWLSGPIPDDFSNQTTLWFLDLSGNNFSSQAFPSGIASLTSLEYLHLSYCSLVGEIPSSLANLKNVREMFLEGNQLTNIPASFGDLDSVEMLDMSSNLITGSIPPELGNMKSIQVLRLYSNQLTGGIPKELAKAAATMINLDIGNNSLSGPIPEELGSLTRLLLLHVQTNQLNGTIPEGLFANMTVLEDVFLYENSFTGELPQDLGLAQRFLIFDCSYNSFSGPIPPNLCKGANQLLRLILMDNNFDGPIPDSLGDCPTLFRVRLSNNRLTGPVPKSFGKSQAIDFLDLINNNLSGTIPAELGNCSKLTSLRVSGNQLTGPIPSALSNLLELDAAHNQLTGSLQSELCSKEMDRIDLSYNKLSGPLPFNLDACKSLSFLYLQNNQISGVIPPSIAFTEELQEIDLSHNHLYGPIPAMLASSDTLQSLDVSYNNLEGPVALTGFLATLNSSHFEGNPNLCAIEETGEVEQILQPCLSPAGRKSRDGSVLKGVPLVLVILAGVISPFICSVALCFCIRSMFYQDSEKEIQGWSMTMFQKVPDLSVEDVLKALDEDNVVGSGSAGKVYKGELRVGKSFRGRARTGEQPFVVKKLKTPVERSSGLFDHGFRAEVETLGNIRHFNVVKLLACCSTRDTKLLVYEYMPNGSLSDRLHGSKGGTLDWDTRYKIALGSAQGLAYLHHDCVPPILHRDVSSSNILLDMDFSARLADFGLAKLVDEIRPPNSVSILMGSHGYIAPERAFAPKATEKTDVYSYGVVLLELVTGKRPVEGHGADGEHITMWVQWKIREKDGVSGALDSRFGGISAAAQEDMIMLLRIGLLCTNANPDKRPGMREVVRMLIDVRNSSEIPMKGLDGKKKNTFRISVDEKLPPIDLPPSPRSFPDTPKSPTPLLTRFVV